MVIHADCRHYNTDRPCRPHKLRQRVCATCVEYVKGSHRWGRWFQPKFFKQGGVDLAVQDPRFEPLPDLDAERGQHEFLAWDMAPGDVIAFHALTLHGASGNLSTSRRRRAWATRW